jgi:hypothetical protein
MGMSAVLHWRERVDQKDGQGQTRQLHSRQEHASGKQGRIDTVYNTGRI